MKINLLKMLVVERNFACDKNKNKIIFDEMGNKFL
jgi:hypothetical protein